MAKLWCTEMQGRVVDRCLQLHGGYGYMLEYPIARAYADARVHADLRRHERDHARARRPRDGPAGLTRGVARLDHRGRWSVPHGPQKDEGPRGERAFEGGGVLLVETGGARVPAVSMRANEVDCGAAPERALRELLSCRRQMVCEAYVVMPELPEVEITARRIGAARRGSDGRVGAAPGHQCAQDLRSAARCAGGREVIAACGAAAST